MFSSIQFTSGVERMKTWFPLIAVHRKDNEIMAVNRIEQGTEVNYGELTKRLFSILDTKFNHKVQCNKEVLGIDPDDDLEWSVKVKRH